MNATSAFGSVGLTSRFTCLKTPPRGSFKINFINIDIHNIEIDYSLLTNISIYPSSNSIEIIPDLISYNPSISANFKTFNIINHSYNLIDNNLILYYKVPLTVDDEELYIEGSVNSISNNSNYLNNHYYDITLNTFLKVKNKTLFHFNAKTITDTFIINND